MIFTLPLAVWAVILYSRLRRQYKLCICKGRPIYLIIYKFIYATSSLFIKNLNSLVIKIEPIFSKNRPLADSFIESRCPSVCLSACLFVPFPCNFFWGLSLALRSHDQIPASHWSTPKNCFKDFGGNLFQRFWRKMVSKILEESSLKDFGGKLFQRLGGERGCQVMGVCKRVSWLLDFFW